MVRLDARKHIRVFAANHAPAVTVEPGTHVTLETVDTSGGQIQSENDTFSTIDWSLMNPCTGPIAVSGAEAGDVLIVDIEDIKLPRRGFSATVAGMGIVRSRVRESSTMFVRIEQDSIHFPQGTSFPVKPHCGIIGVAPAAGQEIPVLYPGDHGGNMDNNLIGPGARLFLPVQASGALFAVGDVHAAQGNGELFGSPVEVAAEVRVRLDVLKTDIELAGPLVETETQWAMTGWHVGEDENVVAALEMAAGRLLDMVMAGWELPERAAMMLLSCTADLAMSAVCLGDGYIVAKATIPKLPGKAALIGGQRLSDRKEERLAAHE